MIKNKEELRIIFMGTPDFAVPSLDILVENGFNIVAVITSTDKWGGRGKKKLLQSPVKKYAVEKDIPVLQPPNLKKPAFIKELSGYKADIQIVVAFRMLPAIVWDMPTLGTINLHGSLLPSYRGAAPINHAVMNGEKVTGLTTFRLKHEIDTGDLIGQSIVTIGKDETAGELHDRMKIAGADLMLDTLQRIVSDEVTYSNQDESRVSKAPKIFHEDCHIDFDKPVREVHNFIRGLSPHPCAWCILDDLQLNVFKAEVIKDTHEELPGTIRSDRKKNLQIAASDGWVSLKYIQLSGRKRMDIASFLNGYKVESYCVK